MVVQFFYLLSSIRRLSCCDQPVWSVGADWKLKERQRPLDTRFLSCLPGHSSSVSALSYQDAAPTICYWSSPSCHALASYQIWCLCISSHSTPSPHAILSYKYIPSVLCVVMLWAQTAAGSFFCLVPLIVTWSFYLQEANLPLFSTFYICFCHCSHSWLVTTKKSAHIRIFVGLFIPNPWIWFIWWLDSIRILLAHNCVTFNCSWEWDSKVSVLGWIFIFRIMKNNLLYKQKDLSYFPFHLSLVTSWKADREADRKILHGSK